VGDIDSSGSSENSLPRTPIRARVYREVLDAGDPTRAAAVIARAARAFARSPRVNPGLSPHAPYTVSPDLLRAAGELARRRRWPVCVHWAETEEEIEWLSQGGGPLRALLHRLDRPRDAIRQDGLEALARAGLLSRELALVHGNHPARGDIERVVRAGATLVHCPGTHAFFRREPFPLRKWLAAGARVALGTDGLSSNLDLDMRREMALLREGHSTISAEAVFEMATRAGARALGFAGSAGAISQGSWADLCAHSFPELSRRELGSSKALLDALTRGRSKVEGVWIGGRRVLAAREFSRALSESPRRIAE
jgi:cytosine/adenosine deaminase-related metal-dependent hydrolase